MNKTFFLLAISCLTMLTTRAQKVMPLYPDSIPNSKPTIDSEEVKQDHGILIIGKISRPTLKIFLPKKEKATGAAVVICPGGGYSIVAAKHEGDDVAKVFAEMGVAAFVLKYRIPNDLTMTDKTIGPLQDAQQAIKTVRDNAVKWNIDPAKLGIVGFSAGGHLAATASTHYATSLIPNPSNTNLRPDFSILVYPVISLQDSLGHIGSRDQLLGKNAPKDKIDLYSNELQVNDSTPPAMLVHATDDNGVMVGNSIAYYQALVKHHIPAEMHLYEHGGHGFGLFIGGTKELWMDRCKNWMEANGWLKTTTAAKATK